MKRFTGFLQISTILFCLLTLIGIAGKAQTSVQPLIIGETHWIQSQILNETRQLNIMLPQNYDASKKYPVLYLLDGSRHEDFMHIVGVTQFFNLMFSMPEMIIVGIENVDRRRDYTFSPKDHSLLEKYPTTGHSEPFIRFLGDEMIPYIESKFSITPTKYLIGQSLGGLLASEILLKRPQLFTHYFIVSPSLWWDKERLLDEAPALLASHQKIAEFVYISVGQGEAKIMRNDAKKLHDLVKNQGNKVGRLEYNLMARENHATILHNSIYEGLQRLFPYKE